MDVWEAIEKRRTIRQFTGKVPDEMLRRLILAGARAPSASNTQPWEFAIATGKKLVALAPTFGLAHNNLAFAYYSNGEYNKAVEHIDKAIELGFEVPPEFLKKVETYRK